MDRHGEISGSTAVVVPPAWGKTKETLLPLALTLVETFRQAGQPITVIRYDGTNRRGESYIDPECRSPGSEYLHFTFSQAARDLTACVDYLTANPASAPRRIVVVTFSLAAVEARHAIASDPGRVAGWVSVVGMADLQSALRTIAGGVDYGYGLLRGVRFGRHELVGVVADMDRTGLDAIRNRIGFLEDVRRDMAAISIPITWIHGKHDAWMDLDRVAEIMSCGRTDNRRLIEVPTGHQLRNSQTALSTFQLIAEEVSEIALPERLNGAPPDIPQLDRRQQAERSRLPRVEIDKSAFWADYLLGRDRTLGMELLTATASYRNFMEQQTRSLGISNGQRVVDLGAGTGDFSLGLCRQASVESLKVVEVDHVVAALQRARQRRQPVEADAELSVLQGAVNLDLGRGVALPFASGQFDAALASLLISYISQPERFLREVFRILKPGGKLVLSSMAPDADISLLYHDGLVEYATPEARSSLQGIEAQVFNRAVQDFLNEGARLFDLEERGEFKFWDERDLVYLTASAGFSHVRSEKGFGEPPQAVIVSARRP